MEFSDLDKILFPPVAGWFLAAKIFFILFDLGVVAFIVYVWVTTIYLKRLWVYDFVEFFTYRAYTARFIDKDWNKIKKRLLTKKEAEFKLAVIDADLLVNDVLFRAGFEGKTLADKLESQKAQLFSNLGAMVDADQLYQRIVRDPKAELDYPAAKAAILAFEQGLKDMAAFTDK
jgi:hypothetical protein